MKWDWAAVPAELEERLKTLEQRERLKALRSGQTSAQIQKATGISYRNVLSLNARVRKALEQIGYDPENGMTLVSPDPQILKGRTAFVKVDEVTGEQRVSHYHNKTDVDKTKQLAEIRQGIFDAAESFKPLGPIKPNKYNAADLCTVYTLTDIHIGSYSWAAETGADWDIKIAKDVITQAFADMMLASPDAEMAVFAQLGDLCHYDGLLALTPTGKNVLDTDTRFPLIVQTAIDVCLGVVELLLHKHQSVHVLMAEGNHDLASSVWLRAVMERTFKNNPRVTVEVSPSPFYLFRWGKTFIGWHHGHQQKMENLPLLFATDPRFRSEYGQCIHTYIHTGHMHHQKVIDRGGIVVEQHPTLAARDAHGARGFLYSNRETKAITYHKEHGEKSRCTVRPHARKVAA